MRKRWISITMFVLFSMLLLSSCGKVHPRAALPDLKVISVKPGEFQSLETKNVYSSMVRALPSKGEETAGLMLMSKSDLSGYSYGQSLWVVGCNESISLRSKPSTSSDALLQMPLYARVTYIADANNGFLYVNYNGRTGYALSKYLDEFEPQIAIGQYMTVVKCRESITLRKTPSKKAAEICQIPLGAVVYAVKEAANGFYMVEYSGLEGYVLSSYLSSVSSTSSGKATVKTGYYYGQPLWVVGVNESISLRAKDSTSSDAVLQIPLYAQVVYLGDAANGFVYVIYNGVAGYALNRYLDEFEPQIAIGEYMRVVKCSKSITLRRTSSTKGEEICQIPLGDIVYVIKEAANGFYMVEYNGMRGFVLKQYLGSLA